MELSDIIEAWKEKPIKDTSAPEGLRAILYNYSGMLRDMLCGDIAFNRSIVLDLKRDLLKAAIEAANGNKSHAAILLNLKRTTFNLLYDKYILEINKGVRY